MAVVAILRLHAISSSEAWGSWKFSIWFWHLDFENWLHFLLSFHFASLILNLIKSELWFSPLLLDTDDWGARAIGAKLIIMSQRIQRNIYSPQTSYLNPADSSQPVAHASLPVPRGLPRPERLSGISEPPASSLRVAMEIDERRSQVVECRPPRGE